MSVRDPPRDDLRQFLARLRFASWSKYDFILAVVPLLLLAGAFGGVTLSLPAPTAAGVGSAAAAVVVAYALFVEPPMGGRRRRAK